MLFSFRFYALPYALFISLLFFLLPVQANGIAALKVFVQQVNAAEGKFAQTQLGSSGKVVAKTAGEFYFSRPGKFIWQTTSPYEQQLQSDGTFIYIWDKDLNQVTIQKLNNALASSPAAVLFGSNQLEKHFHLKESPTREGVQWVDLTPLAQDSTFTRISIGFRRDNLVGMELYDTLGNITLLTFDRIVTYHTASNKDFSFVIPKGADVVRNSSP
ncbi:MAG: outer membrane lipoprotein chaperone LolA [Ottowia sp.]|nr:outer membrane lipoprotein chaperone LolA [Ottowia sp.]